MRKAEIKFEKNWNYFYNAWNVIFHCYVSAVTKQA